MNPKCLFYIQHRRWLTVFLLPLDESLVCGFQDPILPMELQNTWRKMPSCCNILWFFLKVFVPKAFVYMLPQFFPQHIYHFLLQCKYVIILWTKKERNQVNSDYLACFFFVLALLHSMHMNGILLIKWTWKSF